MPASLRRTWHKNGVAMFTPVILAGGNGSRLWPLSRQSFPKQFLALDGQDQGTMFQRTLARLQGLEHSPAVVVSNENHRFIVAEQLRVAKMTSRRIILEPLARNTAPAIALAALEATADGSDPILLVLAADHHIHDEEAFRVAVAQAQVHAAAGRLVTFGITPTHAETGFGYIQCGAAVEQGAFAIAAFKEKPSPEMAEEYLSSGVYLWNSGMFMFRASVFLAELEQHRPDILAAYRWSTPRPTATSCTCRPSSSRCAPMSRWTTRSWSTRLRVWLYRWTLAGTIWAAGRRSGTWARTMPTRIAWKAT